MPLNTFTKQGRTGLAVWLASLPLVSALNNGVGLTPQMGWNSWNHFGCDIDESIVKSTISTLVSSGLRDAGYIYVNLDDCWQISRYPNGTIMVDPDKFPNGLVPLIELAHQNGLKFGVYSDAGNETCQKRPGSLGYETIDADTYAEWGVDYLKYDNCNNEHIPAVERYPVMRDALNATGRPIFFSMCEWGREWPTLWAAAVGNSWRTTSDIKDNWVSMLHNWDHNGLASSAEPGGWNDPDMLEVGNGGMSFVEYQTHFALWCLGKSPLIIGCDITSMSDETKEILFNEDLIAINQDSLGVQASLVFQDVSMNQEVWAGPLSNNEYVVALLNRGMNTETIKVSWDQLGLNSQQGYDIYDVWQHKVVDSSVTDGYSSSVDSHATFFFKMIPN